MGVASMVLGIVSLVFTFLCGCISMITAPIGLILGIVELVRKKGSNEPKGMAVSGVVMCSISILIFIVLVIILGATGFWEGFMEGFNSTYYW